MTSGIFKIIMRIPVPWVFVLTYLVGLVLHFVFPFNMFSKEASLIIRIAGVVLFATGMLLASCCLFLFHKVRTTTTPGEKSVKLVMRGPYGVSRNPMYISLILAYLGEAGFLTQIWPVLVLPLTLIYINYVVIPVEEDLLKKDFKEEYENYCARVHRWL